MEKEYDNTNGGALFPNDRKEKESHPDFRGNINIEGKDYWIKGWKKSSKSGMKFMSLSVTPKEATKPAPASNEEDPF
jgi:uncharacterized protein (DUF736 family)|tara:strand:- start:459 stop:689 length:231 start_codon:yes stop_codon:yes gene_type:complete